MKQNIIYSLAEKVHSNTLLRFFFLKPFRLYKQYMAYRKRIIFHKNGKRILEKFNKALNDLGCNYWLEFGTLIGAVREHGFIKHDDDIDVGMFLKDRPANFKEYMAEKGFNRIHQIIVDDGSEGLEETYESEGVYIDIFYFNQIEHSKEIYCYDFITDPNKVYRDSLKEYGGFWARKIIFPFDGFKNYEFSGVKTIIPLNFDEHLKAHYGNYMQPDSNWCNEKASNSVLIKDKIGKLIDD